MAGRCLRAKYKIWIGLKLTKFSQWWTFVIFLGAGILLLKLNQVLDLPGTLGNGLDEIIKYLTSTHFTVGYVYGQGKVWQFCCLNCLEVGQGGGRGGSDTIHSLSSLSFLIQHYCWSLPLDLLWVQWLLLMQKFNWLFNIHHCDLLGLEGSCNLVSNRSSGDTLLCFINCLEIHTSIWLMATP